MIHMLFLFFLALTGAYANDANEVELTDALLTKLADSCNDPCDTLSTDAPRITEKQSYDLADRAHEKIAALERKLGRAATREELEELQRQIDALKLAIEDLQRRVTGLEIDMLHEIDRLNALDATLDARIDDLDRRMADVEGGAEKERSRRVSGLVGAFIAPNAHGDFGTVETGPMDLIGGIEGGIDHVAEKTGVAYTSTFSGFMPNGWVVSLDVTPYWNIGEIFAVGPSLGVFHQAMGVGEFGLPAGKHAAEFTGGEFGGMLRLTAANWQNGGLDFVGRLKFRGGKATFVTGEEDYSLDAVLPISVQVRF